MILINKDNSIQDLVLTLTELTSIANPVYLLVLTNDFTKNKSRFILPENISANLNRYDRYQLDTALFSDLEVGEYSYSVYQSASISLDESGLGSAIETGKAKVIAPGATPQPIIYNSAPTEYITYKK